MFTEAESCFLRVIRPAFFETSCSGFPMYDITLFCNETDYFHYSDAGFENSVEWLRRCIKGYQRKRRLTLRVIRAFYYFHAIYHVQLQAIIVELYGVNCNENDFEDKQDRWLMSWLDKAAEEAGVYWQD